MASEFLFNYSKQITTTMGVRVQPASEQMADMHYTSISSMRQGVSEADFLYMKEQTWYLIGRAYQNIYGMNMPSDAQYQQTLLNAAMQLRMDERAASMGERDLLHAFEDIIRISDEHYREAQQHMSRASNPVYLRETALDNALEHQKYLSALEELMPKSKVGGVCAQHTGRVYRSTSVSRRETEEITFHQLALTLSAN